MIGKTLSHYRIISELGRGGMGIVYKAEDTRLDRTVAIKVLPAAALTSETDRARFYREAKAAAALTHPHIAVIHGVDEAVPEGASREELRPFIAMEYIDGETLEDRIEKAPLKLDEAVRIASEIASALQLAHEKEIVHRDVKSANVMLTTKGVAKVLDFGLAQTAASTKLTRQGSTLGTVSYMSPEQARGEEVDRRTDIFSVGVVLYQMISGALPFGAEYEQAIIYSIMNQDPEPLTALRTGVPMELERIVEKCLAKDAARRYQHCDDLIADLKGIDAASLKKGSGSRTAAGAVDAVPVPVGAGPVESALEGEGGGDSGAVEVAVVPAAEPAASASEKKWLLPVGFVAGAVLATLATLAITSGDREAGGAKVGFGVKSVSRITIEASAEMSPSIHPGGDRIVYAAGRSRDRHLYYRLIDGGRPIRLVESSDLDENYPTYSPDGNSILFESGGAIFTVEALGGNPRTVIRPKSEGEFYGYPTWSPAGDAIAFMSTTEKIYVYETAARTFSLSVDLYRPHSLAWSPDGKFIAVVSTNELHARTGTNVAPTSIWLIEAVGGAKHQITTTEFMDLSPRWTPDGSALYYVSNQGGFLDIYRQAISASGEREGSVDRITTGLNLHSIDLSRDGNRLVATDFRYRQNIWASPLDSDVTVFVADAVPVTTGDQVIEGVVISPDGTRLAYDSNAKGTQHIFVVPLSGGTPLQLTSRQEPDYLYDWSPYSDFITFHTFSGGSRNVAIVSVDDQTVEILSDESVHERYPLWLSDENTMAYHRDAPGTLDFVSELVRVRRGPSGEWGTPEVIIDHLNLGAKWSTARNMIVYDNGLLSDRAIYTWDPQTEQSRVIPETQGMSASIPMWSRDGNTIYFMAPFNEEGQSLWAVPTDGGLPRKIVDLSGVELGVGSPTVDAERIYYTVSEIESDIWVLDLEDG